MSESSLLLAAQGDTISIIPPLTPPAGTLQDIGSVINMVVYLLFLIAGLATLFYLMMGGIQWITSGGDAKKTEAAGKQITNAIVGIMIVAISWAIVKLLETVLGIKILGGFSIPQPY